MLRKIRFVGLAVAVLGAFTGLCGCGKGGAPAPAAAPPPAASVAAVVAEPVQASAQDSPKAASEVPSPEGVASLRAEDPAVAVNGITVTWGELRQAVGWPQDGTRPTQVQVRRARSVVEQFVQRCLLLGEARRRGLSVTEEEKTAYLAQLAQAAKTAGKTLEDSLKDFPEKPSSALQISLAEALLVVKLGDEVVRGAAVTDAELAALTKRVEGERKATLQTNERTRQDMTALAARSEAATDTGFAALASEHSQGQESAAGGAVSQTLTRKQLAVASGGAPFTLAPGETSGLIETDTAFRIMRVLEVVPPDQEGGEERLKVAQILMRKDFLPDMPTREQLAQNIRKQKERGLLKKCADELAPTAEISCPLFPTLYKK